MSKSNLKAINLKKSINKKAIIHDVSIEINTHEVVGLLGPNGAGKTTTFYMIAGLIGSDNGQVLLNGKDLSAMELAKRAQLGIGYLPQESCVFQNMSVYENVLTFAQNNKKLPKTSQQNDKVYEILKQFELTHLAQTQAKLLSGGEKRRLEIARLMTLDPKFLLLDEPFAGVDPKSITAIKELIKQVLKQYPIGVLIVDHNVKDTLSMCNKAYLMHKGKIVANGSPKELPQNPLAKEVYFGEHWS